MGGNAALQDMYGGCNMPQAQQQEREGRCNGESAASQESARDSSHQNPALCASAAQQGGSASGGDEATSSPISRVCHYNSTCAVSLFTANVVIFSQMQNNLVVEQKKVSAPLLVANSLRRAHRWSALSLCL